MSEPVEDDHFRGTERFELRRRIGAGGFGFVYEAWDRERQERVAIKTLRAPTPATILLLKNEFRVVHDIAHPNLVRLGELFEHGGDWFFTMEFVEGVSFTHFVRPADPDVGSSSAEGAPLIVPSAAFDEVRLRSALGQLVRGLSILHAANKVHRDVKPANVLVDLSGRVVLLDFGVVANMERATAFADTGLTGTAHFMAPEQAASESVGPPSDWYAVGVMLFRSLTGRLPFVGQAADVLEEKLMREAPAPHDLIGGIPEDLDSLCRDLLKSDPNDRPTGPEILERLDGPAARAEITLATAARTFVGRAAELEILGAALREVRSGRAASVIIHGESGVGKTFLVRQLSQRASEDDGSLVFFFGRCFEKESVPFKAFDGIVDQLSEYIGELDDERREHLIPPHVGLLVGTFPVLSRLLRDVDVAAEEQIANPRERRARVFIALRELLRRVARQCIVGIVIDDLQWADADSVALLSEIFEPQSAPPVLFVGTTRSTPAALVEQFGPVMAKRRGLRDILLGRLPDNEARELARTLLGERGADAAGEAVIANIVRESDGHPLFIGDLVEQYVVSPGASALRLEDAMAARIAAQSDAAKRLLDVVAIARTPLADDVLRTAALIVPAEYHTIIARLRGLHLIRSSGRGRDHVVDVFHDRVRRVVVERLALAVLAPLHLRLAEALEARKGGDAEALAHHYRAGGDLARSNSLLLRAAEQAETQLAFERAARLFGELSDSIDDTLLSREMLRKQAESLRNAGRLADSAEILVELSEGADAWEALDLRRVAAEQFVCSGRFEKGVLLIREALAMVGERFPDGRLSILFWLIVARALLAFRGLSFVSRPPPPQGTLERARIDTLWSAGTSFAMTDNARGAYFLTRNFIRALDAGDTAAVVTAIIMETCFVSSEGKKKERRVAVLMERAGALSDADPRPIAGAGMWIARGWTRYMVGDWIGARAGLLEAESQLRDRVVGYRFQLGTTRTILYRTLANAGRFEEMRERIPPVYREAVRQNDQLLVANIRSNAFAWLSLADDAPDRAANELGEAAETLTSRRFLLQHFYILTAECNVASYRGDAAKAYAHLVSTWGKIRGSLLLRIQPVRTAAYEQRARLAVALVCADSPRTKALLDEATAFAKLLAQEGLDCTAAHAALLRGLIETARGGKDAAIAPLEQAITMFDRLEMGQYAAASRYRLGRVVGGKVGEDLVARALQWAEQERVVVPETFFLLLAPAPRALA